MSSDFREISLQDRLCRSDDVLAQSLGGEMVLLDLASEQYFGLDAVGGRIWELLDGRSLAAVLDTLCDDFEAPRDVIRIDLLRLAAEMRDSGLVRLT